MPPPPAPPREFAELPAGGVIKLGVVLKSLIGQMPTSLRRRRSACWLSTVEHTYQGWRSKARQEPSTGVVCRPANGSLSAGNIRRIFCGIFEMPCAECYASVDSRRLSTVELKSKAFLAVDSGACRDRSAE
eukprot:1189125-Prorocentrum_minimum.AAC.2